MLVMVPVLLGGCVRRVVDITSDPSGALVRMNGREIGTTPVEVEIVYYGDYDIQLSRAGCEPLSTSAKVNTARSGAARGALGGSSLRGMARL